MKDALRSWESIRRALASAGRKLFLFDFDGTLSKIVGRPERATLDRRLKPLLMELAGGEDCVAGIISGRSLSDVKRRVGLKKILFSGNHGLEVEGAGIKMIHRKALAKKKTLASMTGELARRARVLKGAIVENKGLTASFHFRRVPTAQRDWALSLIRQMENRFTKSGFFLRPGKKVVEIIPDIGWNKGAAVHWLSKKMNGPLIVYVGDDITDEDAFNAIGKSGVSIRVGRNSGSAAAYALRSQDDMPTLLKRVVALCR